MWCLANQVKRHAKRAEHILAYGAANKYIGRIERWESAWEDMGRGSLLRNWDQVLGLFIFLMGYEI